MLKWIVPKEDMDRLRCSSCTNYLSIFPIYLRKDKIVTICGRCTLTDKDNFIRDEAFETIAKYLIFPCCYNQTGCKEELTPSKLQEHEPFCLFRAFKCPTKTYTRCEWVGPRHDVKQHFEDKHPKLIMKNCQFQWSFNTSYRENLLMTFDNELFIVKKEVDARKETFSCSVQRFANSSATHYDYIVKLISDNVNNWHRLPQKSTEEEEAVTVDRDYIIKKLNHPPHVLVQIEVVKAKEGSSPGPSTKSAEDETNSNVDWNILNEIECPVCFDHMFPPIYQCEGGHSICGQCRLAVASCPMCRKDILGLRNFSLEKLTQHLKCPCKYYKSGCKHVSMSSDIKIHEESCEYGPYHCPMSVPGKCNEQMNKSQIVAHMQDKHPLYIQRTNKIVIKHFQIDSPKKYLYYIHFHGSIFVAQYKYENRKFYWSVQMVDSVAESKKFKFDIDIVDNSNNNLKYYLKGFCRSIRETIDFEDPSTFVMLTYEQLKPLITTQLDYYINILVDDIART